MKINHIFGTVYSMRYPGEEMNEFRRLFEKWRDPEYLESFFESNSYDLTGGFYGGLTIEEAVMTTIADANQLQERMLTLARKNNILGLEKLFRPLHIQDRTMLYSERKAYGVWPGSWIRMYAVKTTDDAYLITGGAIKLTRSMNSREHTVAELAKINRCKDYLKEEGVFDLEGFRELEITL